jgi:hypothetical protein
MSQKFQQTPQKFRGPTTSEYETMNAVAQDARHWVRDAGGKEGSVKARLQRAARNLRGVDFWRIEDAWYGKGGSFSAAAIYDMREAYERFKERQAERMSAEAKLAIARLSSQREYLAATDETLHQEQIAALDYAIQRLGGGD